MLDHLFRLLSCEARVCRNSKEKDDSTNHINLGIQRDVSVYSMRIGQYSLLIESNQQDCKFTTHPFPETASLPERPMLSVEECHFPWLSPPSISTINEW